MYCFNRDKDQKQDNLYVLVQKELWGLHQWSSKLQILYSYFEKGCRKKMCSSHILKDNVGYDQYPVPDTVAFKPTLLLKHMQTYIHGLHCHSYKFLWRTESSKPHTIPFGIVACTFSENFSWNSCINIEPWLPVNKSQSNIVKPPKSDHQKCKDLVLCSWSGHLWEIPTEAILLENLNRLLVRWHMEVKH